MMFRLSYIFICLIGLISLHLANAAPAPSGSWASLFKSGEKALEKDKPSVPSLSTSSAKPATQPPAVPARPVSPPPTHDVPSVKPDSSSNGVPTAYSGKGKTYAEALKSATEGHKDMSSQHDSARKKAGLDEQDPRGQKPSIMSSLKTPDDGQTRLHSSYRGGAHSSENKDPAHIKQPQTKKIMSACESAHGGKHGNAGACGEIRNADSYFKDHPTKDHIPPSSQWKAFGHPGGNLKAPAKEIPACSGGADHSWGCRQFKAMAKTPEKDRPAAIAEHQAKRQKPASPPASPKPATDAEGFTTVAKKGRKKQKRQAELEEDLLEAIYRREFLYSMYY